jgi:hypothetical protein
MYYGRAIVARRVSKLSRFSILLSYSLLALASPELSSSLFVSLIHATHPSLEHRAILAVEGLQGPVSRSGEKNTQKAINFARAFQEVLVYGEVPPQAVLITLPWKKFASIFQKTHLNLFDVDCWPTSFEYFCRRLRSELHGKNTTLAMNISVTQAFDLLSSPLYTHAATFEDLGRAAEVMCEMSHALFTWPYRHPTYQDVSYQCSLEECCFQNGDKTSEQSRFKLADMVKTHQIHRRASVRIRLTSLSQQILDFTDNVSAKAISTSLGESQTVEPTLRYVWLSITGGLRFDNKSRSEPMLNSSMKLLRETLVDAIADIDALEMATVSLSEEDALPAEILCDK